MTNGASANPSWVDIATLSSNYWAQTSGSIYTKNATLDLLIGGSATTSAKFGLINVNSGTPTATISGNLAIAVPSGSAPANTYSVLNGGSINFQTSVGGDAGVASRLFIKNDGNIGIGITNPAAALAVNGINSEFRAGLTTSTGQFGVIGTTRRLNYGDVMFSRNLEGVSGSDNYQTIGTLASTGYNGIEFKYTGDTYFYAQDGNTTAAATVSPISRLTIKGNGNIGIGTTTVNSLLHVRGTTTGNALVTVDQLTSADIFTASASGTTKFTISNAGDLTYAGTTGETLTGSGD
jgi:hypothetical protein